MNFKPGFASITMHRISIDKFIRKHKITNPKEDVKKLKDDLIHFRKLRDEGATCHCGNPIWIIGSAIAGKSCFTCITGEADGSDDYEIE